MPIDESVGTVAVDVVGDYSQLEKDLGEAQDIAEHAGQKIGDAFSSGAAGFNEFSDAAQSVIDQQRNLDQELTIAQATVQELSRAYDEGKITAETLALAEEKLSKATDEASHSAEEAGTWFENIAERALDMVAKFGLVIGLEEGIKETFAAFSRVQSATSALTALTGSAETAGAQIEMLEGLAQDQNLSFPALLEADQRMVAFGFDLAQIPSALQAAADAAAALNTSVDTTANAIDRIAASGMASSRTLVQLGLTTHDLADAMGVSEDAAAKMFKALDQEARLDVITAALQKFQGVSKDTSTDLSRQWQGVKNSFESFFVDLGSFLEPAAQAFLTFFSTVANAAKLLVDGLRVAFQGIKAEFVLVTQGADAARKIIAQYAADEAKREAKDTGGGGANSKTVTSGPLAVGQTRDAATEMEARMERIQDAIDKANKDKAQLVTLDPDKLKPIKDYTSDLEIAIEMEGQQEAAIKKTSEAIAAYGVKLQNAGVDLSGINLAQAYFDQQMIDGAIAIGKIGDEIPPVTDSYGRLARNSEEVAKNQAAVNKESAELGKTLDSMLGKIKPPADAVAESFAKIDAALAKGEWRMVEQDVNRLATTSLPAAIDAQEKYIGALDRTGAAAGKLNDAQTVLYHMQIKLAEETGADATAAVIGLKNTQIETQLLIDKSTGLGQVYVGLMDTFSSTFTDLGKGFSDVIVGAKNMGDAMVGVFKKVESEIVNTVVGYAFKLLKNAILENTGLMKQLTGLFSGIAGGGAGAVGSHVGGAPSIPGLGQGGGSSSGGGLLGGGGLFGGINMVTGVVSAVSGVISAISGLHTNTLLARIEESTRYLKIGLVTQGDSLLNMTHQIRDIQLWGFPAINDALQSILYNGVGQAAMAGGGGGNVIVNFNGPISGVSQDTVESLADQLFRLFKLKNG